MRIVFGLMFALIGVLLIVDFKQVSRDSKAAPHSDIAISLALSAR